jgi:hypothetical protein
MLDILRRFACAENYLDGQRASTCRCGSLNGLTTFCFEGKIHSSLSSAFPVPDRPHPQGALLIPKSQI